MRVRNTIVLYIVPELLTSYFYNKQVVFDSVPEAVKLVPAGQH